MLATKWTEYFPVLSYFNHRLKKEEFIVKFCGALKKHHPIPSESPAINKVAEQGWQQYSKICDFFDNHRVKEGKVKLFSRVLNPEDFDKLYFEKIDDYFKLGPRSLYIRNYICDNPTAFESLSDQDKNNIQSLLNVAGYRFKKSGMDGALIDYNPMFLTSVANTQYPQTMTLFELHTNVDEYSPYEGNTPLLLAVSKGWNHKNPNDPAYKSSNFYPQKEIIKKLIEKKVDVNDIHLANGMTSLHIACLRGDDPELIKILLKNGGDIHAKDYQGHTPLELMNFNYETTQEIINTLTYARDDEARRTASFGQFEFSEHQSWTATLPLKHERLENQVKIRAIIKSMENNTFGLFALNPNHDPGFVIPAQAEIYLNGFSSAQK